MRQDWENVSMCFKWDSKTCGSVLRIYEENNMVLECLWILCPAEVGKEK